MHHLASRLRSPARARSPRVRVCCHCSWFTAKRRLSGLVTQWLSGPLRHWAEEPLSPTKLEAEGLLDVGGVQDLWHRHLTKREQNATALWNILMLRSWSEHWLKP